jgi:hypothetical protein
MQVATDNINTTAIHRMPAELAPPVAGLQIPNQPAPANVRALPPRAMGFSNYLSIFGPETAFFCAESEFPAAVSESAALPIAR